MTYSDAKQAFERLFANQMSFNEAIDFLTLLYKNGETTEEIRAAVEVMRENSINLDINEEIKDKLIDNCGTGGDKSGSFNISTTVSVVLSSLGCYVAKHGNRSITSKSGSADMLEALGVKLDLSNEHKKTMLEDCGFTFLFAQNHHPAMKHIMPIRKSMPNRTIFNILGPLTNPATVKRHLIGVFDYTFAPKMAEVLRQVGSKKGVIVCSNDGLDEVSVCDITRAIFFDSSSINETEIDPTEYGIKKYSQEELKGGDALHNAKITYDLLKHRIDGAKKDIVVINTALALMSADLARDIKDGIEMARYAIDSNIAFNKLEKIIAVSNTI